MVEIEFQNPELELHVKRTGAKGCENCAISVPVGNTVLA